MSVLDLTQATPAFRNEQATAESLNLHAPEVDFGTLINNAELRFAQTSAPAAPTLLDRLNEAAPTHLLPAGGFVLTPQARNFFAQQGIEIANSNNLLQMGTAIGRYFSGALGAARFTGVTTAATMLLAQGGSARRLEPGEYILRLLNAQQGTENPEDAGSAQYRALDPVESRWFDDEAGAVLNLAAEKHWTPEEIGMAGQHIYNGLIAGAAYPRIETSLATGLLSADTLNAFGDIPAPPDNTPAVAPTAAPASFVPTDAFMTAALAEMEARDNFQASLPPINAQGNRPKVIDPLNLDIYTDSARRTNEASKRYPDANISAVLELNSAPEQTQWVDISFVSTTDLSAYLTRLITEGYTIPERVTGNLQLTALNFADISGAAASVEATPAHAVIQPRDPPLRTDLPDEMPSEVVIGDPQRNTFEDVDITGPATIHDRRRIFNGELPEGVTLEIVPGSRGSQVFLHTDELPAEVNFDLHSQVTFAFPGETENGAKPPIGIQLGDSYAAESGRYPGLAEANSIWGSNPEDAYPSEDDSDLSNPKWVRDGDLIRNSSDSTETRPISEGDFASLNLRGVDLSDADLSRANLSETDLSGANLSNTNLSDANLESAELDGANLQGADLSRATLNQASFFDANLQGATLNHATAHATQFGGANMSGSSAVRTDFSSASFQLAYHQIATLQGANLSFANLNQAQLQSVNLQNANLSNANLQSARLNGANLNGANISEADFTQADTSMTTLSNVTATIPPLGLRSERYTLAPSPEPHPVDESPAIDTPQTAATPSQEPIDGRAIWRVWEEGLVHLHSGEIRLFTDGNFAGLNLSNLNLSSANLTGADLSGADLSGANLNGASLVGANLTDATLTRATLHYAYLDGANLTNANLTGADFWRADITNIILTNANQTNTNFGPNKVIHR